MIIFTPRFSIIGKQFVYFLINAESLIVFDPIFQITRQQSSQQNNYHQNEIPISSVFTQSSTVILRQGEPIPALNKKTTGGEPVALRAVLGPTRIATPMILRKNNQRGQYITKELNSSSHKKLDIMSC